VRLLCEVYTKVRKAGVTDVLLLYFSLCFCVSMGQCLGETLVNSVPSPSNNSWDFANLAGNVQSVTASVPNVSTHHLQLGLFSATDTPTSSSLYFAHERYLQHGLLLVVNLVLAVWRLWLSNDVEKNPGPPKTDIEKTVNEAMSKMTDQLSSFSVTLDQKLDKITRALEQQNKTVNRIEQTQQDMKEELSLFSKDIQELKEAVSANKTSVDALTDRHDDLCDIVTDLQDEIDRLEGFSKRNNVKFFGLREEKSESCEETVHDTLAKYMPEVKWSSDVIERAHRLGRPNPNSTNPRPMIARFQRWGEVMALMTSKGGRDRMQTDGIRVSQDLTRRQSTRLRELRAEGKVGYYKKGKLHIKDPTPEPSDRRSGARHSREGSPVAANHVANVNKAANSGQPIRNQNGGDDVGNPGVNPGASEVSTASIFLFQGQPIINREISDVDKNSRTSENQNVSEKRQSKQKESDNAKPRTRSVVTNDRQPSLHEAWRKTSSHNDNVNA